MFSLAGNMKFITLNQDYIKELHTVHSEVYFKLSNYDDKPYFGILLNANGRTYAIPLSSTKEKHKKWKNINQMSTGKGKKFCCDFRRLESICDNYAINL